eukprot:81888_1
MMQDLPSEEKQESRCTRGACICICLLLVCVGAGAFFFFVDHGHGPNSSNTFEWAHLNPFHSGPHAPQPHSGPPHAAHAPHPVALSTQKIPLVTANGPKWAKVKNALATPITGWNTWKKVRNAVANNVGAFNTPSLDTFLTTFGHQTVFHGGVTVYQVLDFIRQRALGVKMKSLPILPSGTTAKVTLTQGQVLDLNAFGFFGLLKRPFDAKSQDPNISLLFRAVKPAHGHPPDNKLRQQKIRCIMHYFARMMATHPNDLTKHHITVFRNSVPKGGFQKFLKKKAAGRPLIDVEFRSGRIEEYPSQGAIEIDFANKTFGGGFLGSGAAQEENRLIIAPDTFVAAMIAETMDTNESITVVGAEIVSSYIGYGHHGVAGKTGFTWKGNFQDHTAVGPTGHRLTAIVAIDAKQYYPNTRDHQLRSVNMQRSFLKQFAGFSVPDSFPLLKDRQTVVIGLLGCVAELQFVKQWAILSLTGAKKMVFYYSPRNQDLEDFAKWAQENRMTAGKLLKALEHLQFANRVKITETGGQCKSNALKVLKDGWRVWRRFIAGEP